MLTYHERRSPYYKSRTPSEGPFPLPLPPSARNIERNCIEGDFMIGKTISHYKVLEKIGEGDMGGVYWAEDTNFSELVR